MKERALCFHIRMTNPDDSFWDESNRLFALNSLVAGIVKDYVKEYPGAEVVEVADPNGGVYSYVIFFDDHG